MTKEDLFAACMCDNQDGSDFCVDVDGYAWELAMPREVDPVPVKGIVAPWPWKGPELVPASGWHDARYGEEW
jgi:hypothetical protein